MSDFERIQVFVSQNGTKHLAKTHSWGTGRACSPRFLFGQVVEGVTGDIDCGICQRSLDG